VAGIEVGRGGAAMRRRFARGRLAIARIHGNGSVVIHANYRK
jgi:hypothetical protein